MVGGGELKKISTLEFRWSGVISGIEEEHIVEVRCDHVCARGVPCPAGWQTAARRSNLSAAAKNATKEAQAFFGGDMIVECRFQL